MVTSSPDSVALKEPLTGDYELFMYTFATGGDSAGRRFDVCRLGRRYDRRRLG